MVTPGIVRTEQNAPVPVRCRKCSDVLGEVAPNREGVQLTFGTAPVAVVGGVKLRCLNCGWVTKWHPNDTQAVDRAKHSE